MRAPSVVVSNWVAFVCENLKHTRGLKANEKVKKLENSQNSWDYLTAHHLVRTVVAQSLRGQLDVLPEAQVGQLRAEQTVWRLILAMAEAEAVQVPVRPLQVRQTLRHFAMARLPHPRHTVEAFHQAARTPDST